jgi:hypothetical protein
MIFPLYSHSIPFQHELVFYPLFPSDIPLHYGNIPPYIPLYPHYDFHWYCIIMSITFHYIHIYIYIHIIIYIYNGAWSKFYIYISPWYSHDRTRKCCLWSRSRPWPTAWPRLRPPGASTENHGPFSSTKMEDFPMKNGGFTKDLPLESPCLLVKSQVSYEKWIKMEV